MWIKILNLLNFIYINSLNDILFIPFIPKLNNSKTLKYNVVIIKPVANDITIALINPLNLYNIIGYTVKIIIDKKIINIINLKKYLPKFLSSYKPLYLKSLFLSKKIPNNIPKNKLKDKISFNVLLEKFLSG